MRKSNFYYMFVLLIRKICNQLHFRERLLSGYFQVAMSELRWITFELGLVKGQKVNQRIVISLTSYPARFEFLHKTLKTLITQSVTPNAIRVYIEEKDFSQINKDLLRLEEYGVVFCPTPSGWKSATKLIPELMRAGATEDLILYLDDDIIYRRSLVKRLAKTILDRPDLDVVYNWGQIVPKWDEEKGEFPKYSTWNSTDKDLTTHNFVVPLGVAGVLLRRTAAPPSMFNFSEFRRISETADDLWFWCHYVQAQLKIGKSSSKCSAPIYWKGSQGDALWRLNIVKGENDNTLQRMIREYPKLKKHLEELDF